MLSKLNYYGIKHSSLRWFDSYLSNRFQYVDINQHKSDTIPISIGVPQGSILGPLLFIIYINDIDNSTSFFNFIKYADDTTLFTSVPITDQYDPQIIDTEVNKVYKWLCLNRLSLNINKSKFIIFHNKNKNVEPFVPVIKVNTVSVERVANFNFLGIIINENLNWNSQTGTKIAKAVGIICKLKHFLPLYVLKTLYNSLILPHFTYGILIWGMDCNLLFTVQKKVLRIITNSSFISHSEPIFKSLELLKLADIHKLFVLKFYYQHCHNWLPFYLQSFAFKHRLDVHHYETRNRHLLDTFKVKLKCSENSLKKVIPKLINNTPQCIIDKIFTHSLQGFVSYTKQYF